MRNWTVDNEVRRIYFGEIRCDCTGTKLLLSWLLYKLLSWRPLRWRFSIKPHWFCSLILFMESLKRKGHQDDCTDHHWGCWRQASTSPVMTRAVTLTTFAFLWSEIGDGSRVHPVKYAQRFVLFCLSSYGAVGLATSHYLDQCWPRPPMPFFTLLLMPRL